MAACVRRALRSILPVTARCTGPNRCHALRPVTCRLVQSAASPEEKLQQKQKTQRTKGRQGGPTIWAALGFSLFSRNEEEAQRKEDEMILLLKKAKLALLREQFSAASSFLHQAVALAQQLHHLEALGYCYSLMANLALVRGQLDQAEKLFKASLSVLLSRGTPQNDNAVIETSLKLATIYVQQNRLDLAELGFSFCVESLEEKLDKVKEEEKMEEAQAEEERVVLKDTRLLLGLVLESRARFWIQTLDLVRAEQDFRRSLGICSEEQGEDHPQSLVLISDLATVLDLRGNRAEARALVQKAVDLGRTQDHPDLHVFLSNKASIFLNSGDLEAAGQFYREALTLAKHKGDEEALEHIRNGLKELRATRGRQKEEQDQEEPATRGRQREEQDQEEPATRGRQREEQDQEEPATRGRQREEQEQEEPATRGHQREKQEQEEPATRGHQREKQ